MWRLLPFTLKSPTTLSPWARLNLLENFYHLVAAEYGRGLLVACRETADLFRSVLLLPGTFTLLPGTIKRSRILPCGKGPHFYLVYTSLPWMHFCLVRSEVYHLYLLSWPFVKGARKSFSHRSHSFSVVSFNFSPATHFPYGWGFDCCHADAINRHCIAPDKKMLQFICRFFVDSTNILRGNKHSKLDQVRPRSLSTYLHMIVMFMFDDVCWTILSLCVETHHVAPQNIPK